VVEQAGARKRGPTPRGLTVHVQTYLTPSLYESLVALAADNDRSIAGELRVAATTYVARAQTNENKSAESTPIDPAPTTDAGTDRDAVAYG
jgi:hypothetical protein